MEAALTSLDVCRKRRFLPGRPARLAEGLGDWLSVVVRNVERGLLRKKELS